MRLEKVGVSLAADPPRPAGPFASPIIYVGKRRKVNRGPSIRRIPWAPRRRDYLGGGTPGVHAGSERGVRPIPPGRRDYPCVPAGSESGGRPQPPGRREYPRRPRQPGG